MTVPKMADHSGNAFQPPSERASIRSLEREFHDAVSEHGVHSAEAVSAYHVLQQRRRRRRPPG